MGIDLLSRAKAYVGSSPTGDAMQIKITLPKHIEAAILREAESRHMEIHELCRDLLEVALVHLGSFGSNPATSIDEQATRVTSDMMDDCY